MPKISVVMPVMNNELFLAEALDSILCQTFEDFEVIIIVEHHSSPKSLSILESYERQDNRIKLIYNDRQLGISASLNRGIKLAKGEYIARMDADDIAYANRLSYQSEFLDHHQNIDICGSEVEFIDKKGNKIKNADNYSKEPANIKSDLLFYCCVRHPTVMMRLEAIYRHGLFYDESLSATEDFELWNRSKNNVLIANLSEILLKYRWYNENATHSRKDEGISNYIKVMKMSFEQISLRFSDEELKLLCPLTSKISFGNLIRALTILSSCEKKIIAANQKFGTYDHDALFHTLEKRFYWKKHPFRLFFILFIRFFSKVFYKYRLGKTLSSVANYIEINGFLAVIKRVL